MDRSNGTCTADALGAQWTADSQRIVEVDVQVAVHLQHVLILTAHGLSEQETLLGQEQAPRVFASRAALRSRNDGPALQPNAGKASDQLQHKARDSHALAHVTLTHMGPTLFEPATGEVT